VSATILFDGVCNLCNGVVRFVIARDPHARFRFAALSSDAGHAVLHAAGLRLPIPDTVVLVEDGAVYVRSEAALRIARRLSFPWPVLFALMVVPRPLRDAIYDAIARRRYRWFGQRDACMVPTPEQRRRFLAPPPVS
jgi:predicted DCC family thiol-disulfide oxidoreductase YuxK